MKGISSHGKDAIDNIIEDLFDKIALNFVGDIPKLRNKKFILFSAKSKYSLAHLFVQAMKNKVPNQIEQSFLKGLLNSSHSYIESLKSRTKASILDRIDGVYREASIKKEEVSNRQISDILNEEMERAQSQLKAIVEAESTKVRNLGTAMDISRVAASVSDQDPNVYFAVVRDGATCNECLRLHLKDDQVTPRIWKFSDLKHSYHKRGEDKPSAFGIHPHCRCTLIYLSKDFGFDKQGTLVYKGPGHDEYEG